MFHFIDNLSPQLPYKNIMTRLGARLSTQISDKDKIKIDNIIYSAQTKIKIKAVYKLFDIENVDSQNNVVKIASQTDQPCDETFSSSGLTKNLAGCNYVYLVGITAGSQIVEARDQSATNGEILESVITDAVGSECVEAGLELLHNMLIQDSKRKGLSVNKFRFSPGYSDLALDYQHIIAKMLPLDKIGITLSESAIMYPEKSITAFIGVS